MSWLEDLADVETKRDQGERLLTAGAYEKARPILEMALETLEKCYKTQREVLTAKIDQARACIVEKNMQLGDTYWAEGNMEMARECYQVSLDLARSPRERDEVHIKLGQIDQKEAPSENLDRLGQKTQDQPDSPEALYDFATELAMERYLPEAIRYFQKLVEMTPDDADVYYRLGNALFDSQRWDEARAAYEKALSLEFDDKAEIHYRLGCLDLDGIPNPYEAKKQFRRALEIRADHVECLKRMARLNKLEESFEGAIECLHNALKYEPDDAGMWLELGDLYENLGRHEKSKEFWTKAIEVDPDGDAADYAREKLDRLELERESSQDTPSGE